MIYDKNMQLCKVLFALQVGNPNTPAEDETVCHQSASCTIRSNKSGTSPWPNQSSLETTTFHSSILCFVTMPLDT